MLCLALTRVNPSAADVLTDWNERTLPVVSAAAPAGRGATPATFIDIAIVHAAMYDAIQAYDKRFEPYAGAIAGATGSPIVAAAKAARDVLVNRFPMQAAAIGTTYSNYLLGLIPAPSPADIAGGEAVGTVAANNVIALRDGDGSFPATFPQFTGGTGPGQWRPNAGTPGMVSPWAGAVRLFALESLSRCEPEAPPALTSIDYAEAYNEVKRLGGSTSVRSTRQGQVARMYSSNFTNLLSRLLRDIATTHLAGNSVASLGNRARLLALSYIAITDSFICAWESKTRFNLWRPIHAIPNGDQDGNILTEKDASWVPYSPTTPNYPDYTSGANNVTGSLTRMLQLFFGSDKPFDFYVHAASPSIAFLPTDPNPRTYTKFSDMAKDVIDARVYMGIHFRFADTEARSQGRRVANYTFKNILGPVSKK